MGIKTITKISMVEVCPNQDEHDKESAIQAGKSSLTDMRSLKVPDFRNHHYCPQCGARYILKGVECTIKVCDNCGEEIDSIDVYCPNCGVKAR